MVDEASVLVPKVLTELYALVLESNSFGRQLLWSSEEKAWLVSSETRTGGYMKPAPVGDDPTGHRATFQRFMVPRAESIAAAVIIAEALKSARWCQRCGMEGVAAHAIAPSVFGDPELLCVYRPAAWIVESYGGNGQLKHWGTAGGCRSVRGGESRDGNSNAGWELFGTPLPTPEALDREWCSMCRETAARVHTRASAEAGEGADERSVESAISRHLNARADAAWIGVLIDQVDGRNRRQLLQALREAEDRS